MIGALCYVYELFMTRLAFVVLNAPYGGVYELTIMGDNVCEIFDQGTLPCGENMLDGRSEEDLLDLQKREAELWKRESDQVLFQELST